MALSKKEFIELVRSVKNGTADQSTLESTLEILSEDLEYIRILCTLVDDAGAELYAASGGDVW